MKFNWYQVVVLVVLITAAVGWAMYADQRGKYEELLSRQPTPQPSVTIYGLFEKTAGNTVSVGIQEAGGTPGTLVSTDFTLAGNVSVLRRDATANEYVAATITDLQPGTWVQLGTDASGTVITITAGR